MIVVSDTSPINYLLLIGLVDVLPQLFGKVVIPQAVLSEMKRAAAPQPVSRWISNLPDWVEIHTVLSPDPTLTLGAGETEAITLALKLRADALLIDDRKGRREALARGLTVSGTLNVLDMAAERGLIELEPALKDLLQTSFRASAKVIREVLKRHEHRK